MLNTPLLQKALDKLEPVSIGRGLLYDEENHSVCSTGYLMLVAGYPVQNIPKHQQGGGLVSVPMEDGFDRTCYVHRWVEEHYGIKRTQSVDLMVANDLAADPEQRKAHLRSWLEQRLLDAAEPL